MFALGHDGDAGSRRRRATRRSVEVGVKFTTDTFGTVSGVRFYKATANTGTHIGNLWTASGQLLATATFTSESASGWQTVTLREARSHQPNTTYVASYFAPTATTPATRLLLPHPAARPNGGASLDNPPLHALRTPTDDDQRGLQLQRHEHVPVRPFGTNYWVDVVFTPTPRARAGDERARRRRRHTSAT